MIPAASPGCTFSSMYLITQQKSTFCAEQALVHTGVPVTRQRKTRMAQNCQKNLSGPKSVLHLVLEGGSPAAGPGLNEYS